LDFQGICLSRNRVPHVQWFVYWIVFHWNTTNLGYPPFLDRIIYCHELQCGKKSHQMFATLCSPPLTKGQREAAQDRGSGSERRFRERNWYWQLGFDTFLLRGSLGWFILDHFGYSLDKNLTSQERSRKYDGWRTRKMLIGEGQRCNWLCGAFKLVSGQTVTYFSILDLGGIAVSQRSGNKDVAFSQRMCNLLIVSMLRVWFDHASSKAHRLLEVFIPTPTVRPEDSSFCIVRLERQDIRNFLGTPLALVYLKCKDLVGL